MKIAILSLIPRHNYGGILQSYALQTYLESIGHNVDVLSKKKDDTKSISFFTYVIRLIRKIIGLHKAPIKFEDYENQIYNNLQRFVDSYLKIRYINRFSEINERDYDCIIVGSDQVWRPKYFEEQYSENIKNSFLSFTKDWNIKRIAYAASFGTDKWEYSDDDTKECARLSSLFDAISVRENAGANLTSMYLGVQAKVVCDPTILLTPDDYLKFIDGTTYHNRGDLLVYCLDKSDELEELVDKICGLNHFKPFTNNTPFGVTYTIQEQIKPSVEQWIRSFSEASFVVTDSFHACVFSILFKKPFVVLGNRNRGMSRFRTLLKTFGLEERLLSNSSEFKQEYLTMDEKNIENTIKVIRLESANYLKNLLNETTKDFRNSTYL